MRDHGTILTLRNHGFVLKVDFFEVFLLYLSLAN